MLPIAQHLLVEKYELGSYLGECAWYWLFMSVVHAALFILGVLFITALSFF